MVVALTGAILPFQGELACLIAPERCGIHAPPGGARIDWPGLRDQAERLGDGVVDTLPLRVEDGQPAAFAIQARPGEPPLAYDQILLDPYTGREIARTVQGRLSDGAAEILPFLARLHFNLAAGGWGETLLGAMALAWTLDAFIGLWLTLPRANWRKWSRAWRVRLPAHSSFRLNFDLHRAVGLWIWPLVLLFAWTGVAFNLPSVYGPVMAALTGSRQEIPAAPATGTGPILDFRAALAAARERAAEVARARPLLVVRQERELRRKSDGTYAFAFRSDYDRTDRGANSWITIDARTGLLLGVEVPTGERFGNTADYWLSSLHTASVFGLPWRIVVAVSGIAIAFLTVTGVIVWLHKLRVRHRWRREPTRREA